MMSADWKAELEETKKATEEDMEEVRKKEEELRKKYEGDQEKIIDLIYSQLKPVVETFREEGKEKTDQPRIDKRQSGIVLHLPIVHGNTHIGLSISFGLIFTDKGYGVTTRKRIYDHTKDRVFTSQGFVDAPVEIEGIQNQIREFIRDRAFAIKMLEEKTKRMKRRW